MCDRSSSVASAAIQCNARLNGKNGHHQNGHQNGKHLNGNGAYLNGNGVAHISRQPAKQQMHPILQSLASLKDSVRFYLYRGWTICHSVATLYTLPQETVDRFMAAFKVFDYDWANETEMISVFGKDYMGAVRAQLVDWYKVANYLCALGEVEKMYVPPAIDPTASLIKNQNMFEEMMADKLHVGPGDHVLEIGCGRGRIAHHVAEYTGARVSGINIDRSQLDNAIAFAKSKGMEKQLQYSIGDLNDPLPFADGSLDAVYHIQVFTYAKDLLAVFKEIHRVLKPGGRLSCLDWCTLDAYDATNKEHRMLMQRMKPLLGAIGCPTNREYAELMRQAGFEIEVDENPSVDGLQAPLIDKVDKDWGKFILRTISTLTSMRLIPSYFKTMIERQMQDCDAFIKADKMRLSTTSYWIVGRKI